MKFVAKSKSGIFYIGDPCYVMNSDLYEKWGEDHGYDDGSFNLGHEDASFCVCSNGIGDGCFEGSDRTFPVDAGCFAIVPKEFWDEKATPTTEGIVIELEDGEFDKDTLKMEVNKENKFGNYFTFFKTKNGIENQNFYWIDCRSEDEYEDEEYDDDEYYEDE